MDCMLIADLSVTLTQAPAEIPHGLLHGASRGDFKNSSGAEEGDSLAWRVICVLTGMTVV